MYVTESRVYHITFKNEKQKSQPVNKAGRILTFPLSLPNVAFYPLIILY